MSRSIIEVDSAGPAGEFAKVRESATGIGPDFAAGQIIDCRLPADGAHVGDQVYQLMTSVQAIQDELDYTPAQGSPPAPLLLDDRAPRAQELPWEALRRNGQNFLALEDGRPMGRIAERTSGADELTSEPLYDAPLKVIAIISAAGIDGSDEWKQVYGGLKAKEARTPFRLHTIFTEDSVEQAIDAANDPAVSKARLVSDDPLVRRYDEVIASEINEFQPHVLHFFCHGMPGETPQLELATILDKNAGKQRGSILLDDGFFRDLAAERPNIWCVLLNCCHGATRRESCSLARRIVQIGFPVAIGMREAVQPRDAHVFCGELYRAIGEMLHDSFQGGNPTPRIDWVTALTEPRRRICTQRVQSMSNAHQVDEWAFPVIYVQSQPFRLKRPRPNLVAGELQELMSETLTLKNLRSELSQTGVPGGVIQEIDDRIADLVGQLSSNGGGPI